MARAISRDGESKQGLVVTLVFFILATIGAGVAAYLGFANQDKLKKEKDEALKKQAEADRERNWFRFQVAVYRSYLGTPPPAAKAGEPKAGEEAPKPGEVRIGEELPGQMKEFAAGGLGKDYDDYKPVKDLIEKKLMVRSKWDPAKNRPEKSYEELFKEYDAQITQLRADLRLALDEKALAQKEKTDAETAKKKAQDDYTAALADLKKKQEEARAAAETEIKTLTEELKVSGGKSEPLVKELQDKLEKVEKDKKTLNNTIKDLEGKVAQVQQKLDTSMPVAVEKETAVREPRGEIVRVHTSLRRATINIGRNDGLKPGVTFSVHGRQADGKPKRFKKADVEVLKVDARTAEVEITNVVVWSPDRKLYEPIDVLGPENKDPVIKGDVLLNPLWNPNSKTHIAVAGYLDFVGGSPAQMNSFIRRLEDQNVIVDAWVDLTDGKIKGPGMTRQTEYILRGAELDGREPGAPREKDTLKEANESIKKLFEEAKHYGVEVMRPERFLRDTGFALPRRSTVQD